MASHNLGPETLAAFGARDLKADKLNNPDTRSENPYAQAPIRAELIGSNKAITADTTAVGTTPVLILCRQLLAQGVDPDRAMEVYRGATLALRIKSIGKAAGLEIASDGVGFRPARQPDAVPLGRYSERGAA